MCKANVCFTASITLAGTGSTVKRPAHTLLALVSIILLTYWRLDCKLCNIATVLLAARISLKLFYDFRPE